MVLLQPRDPMESPCDEEPQYPFFVTISRALRYAIATIMATVSGWTGSCEGKIPCLPTNGNILAREIKAVADWG